MAAYLPFELVILIVERLPVVPRFAAASRSFLLSSLLKSQQF